MSQKVESYLFKLRSRTGETIQLGRANDDMVLKNINFSPNFQIDADLGGELTQGAKSELII